MDREDIAAFFERREQARQRFVLISVLSAFFGMFLGVPPTLPLLPPPIILEPEPKMSEKKN